jgi:hypothetical protein
MLVARSSGTGNFAPPNQSFSPPGTLPKSRHNQGKSLKPRCRFPALILATVLFTAVMVL